MIDYAAKHCNADLCCYAVIHVDKSAGLIGGQVNAIYCSSTYFKCQAGIGYLEFALQFRVYYLRFQREFNKYKNVGGRALNAPVECNLTTDKASRL